MVKVILPTILGKTVDDEREIIVPASTIKEVLVHLVRRYGEPLKHRLFDADNQPKRALNYYVNGKNAHFLNELATPLKATDELVILPRASGG
ncbi:MAG: MoaD/ThiS family protein [Candidatus Bathyarchaeota archaeon]|nr:MAG: MoaD/ThiS family protein [Candidatus Bathyarchaeota archaeon]